MFDKLLLTGALLLTFQWVNAQTISNISAKGAGDSKNLACEKAMENARFSAAQQSEVYIFSDLEVSQTASGEHYSEDVKKYIKETTYGNVKTLDYQELPTKYDSETAQVICEVIASFEVDTSAIKELTKLKLDQLNNQKQQQNRISQLQQTLSDNDNQFKALTSQLMTLNKPQNAEYQVTCNDNESFAVCKNRIHEKAEKDAQALFAQQLSVDSSFVMVKFLDCACKTNTSPLDDGFFSLGLTGLFNFKTELLNPYQQENVDIGLQLASLQQPSEAIDNQYKPALNTADKYQEAEQALEQQAKEAKQTSIEKQTPKSQIETKKEAKTKKDSGNSFFEWSVYTMGASNEADYDEIAIKDRRFGLQLAVNESWTFRLFNGSENFYDFDDIKQTNDGLEYSGFGISKRLWKGPVSLDLGVNSISYDVQTNSPMIFETSRFINESYQVNFYGQDYLEIVSNLRSHWDGFNIGWVMNWKQLDTQNLNGFTSGLYFDYQF